MLETGVIIGPQGVPLYWHLPNNRTEISLPDSSALWNFMWEHKNIITGFAHSHPGKGAPSATWEDITTFSAKELGLGKKLIWPIISEDTAVYYQFSGPNKYHYTCTPIEDVWFDSWIYQLHRFSYNSERRTI